MSTSANPTIHISGIRGLLVPENLLRSRGQNRFSTVSVISGHSTNPTDVRFTPKADIAERAWHVRFVPIPDKVQCSKVCLLDHLVGDREQRRGDCDAKCLGGLEVDREVKLGRHLYGQIGRLFAPQNPHRRRLDGTGRCCRLRTS